MQKRTIILTILAFAFLFLQIGYHYYLVHYIFDATIMGAAFAGTTLIGFALITGPLSKLFPKLNFIVNRRDFGVLGFTFVLIHIMSVIIFSYNLNLAYLFSNLNPLAAPVVFGFFAFLLFIPAYLTSTDIVLRKLGYRKWKFAQRLVYVAYILSVLHFLIMNPLMLYNFSGYLLLLTTILVFSLELAEFFAFKKTLLSKIIGYLIILFAIIFFYLEYMMYNLVIYIIASSVILAIIFYAFRSKPNNSK